MNCSILPHKVDVLNRADGVGPRHPRPPRRRRKLSGLLPDLPARPRQVAAAGVPRVEPRVRHRQRSPGPPRFLLPCVGRGDTQRRQVRGRRL